MRWHASSSISAGRLGGGVRPFALMCALTFSQMAVSVAPSNRKPVSLTVHVNAPGGMVSGSTSLNIMSYRAVTLSF